MQTFIDFLADNYLWFLIISLILIFALIGYLVDTSEKKQKEKKKNSLGNIPVLEVSKEASETREISLENKVIHQNITVEKTELLDENE